MSKVILSSEILRDLATVGQCAGKVKGRPILERVVFEPGVEGSIKAYATDSFRIAEVVRPTAEGSEVIGFHINAKDLEGAVKAIGAKYRGDVVIEVSDTTITISGGGSSVALYRQDQDGNGKYPDLSTLWPTSFSGFDGSIAFNPAFLATLPKLAGMDQFVQVKANDNSRPVLFVSKDGATKYLLMPVRS
jgi:DNA polymerase III sliding clamp (beta) subunit (PCNA family)